jgi:diacylglycerol kinase family enzyme
MRLAPQADLTDGRLDVVCSAVTSRLRFLRVLPRVFRGTHLSEPSVSVHRARVVGLTADRVFRVFADGDPVGDLPATVTVRPAAVRVLLPAAPAQDSCRR